MKLFFCQYNPEWEDAEKNKLKIEEMTAEIKDADLLIFPEMTLTGFTMNSKKFAVELSGNRKNFFSQTAARLGAEVFAGLIEKTAEGIFNSLVHFDKRGEVKTVYRKVHLFTPAGEHLNFSAGNKPVSAEINNVKFGLSICYDLRFPELYRYYAVERADVIVNIANWPVQRIAHYQKLLTARAIENQCFAVGVNRTGSDPFNKYSGSTMAVNPLGETVYRAGAEEGIFPVEINIEEAGEIRNKLKFLNDIRMI